MYSPDCLQLALLLLRACACSLQLYSLPDLLLLVRSAAALGCSCKPQHRGVAGAFDAPTPAVQSASASGSGGARNSGMGDAAGGAEAVRPQLHTQGTDVELHEAIAPVLQMVCDRIMQLVIELPPPPLAPQPQTGADRALGAPIPRLAELPTSQQMVQSSRGNADVSKIEAVECTPSGSLPAQLRWQAVAQLDVQGESSQWPLLLQAWACLNSAAYFSAPPSPVRRCQLCVAMYAACESQLFTQSGLHPSTCDWWTQVKALAAAMPLPPDRQWLEEGERTMDSVRNKAPLAVL